MELALANDPNITIITCKNERNQLKKKKNTKKKDVYAQSSHMLLQDEDNELHRDWHIQSRNILGKSCLNLEG